eukprot:TRINITY_DN5116_c0_g1_i10.p1 TRINITY_DN5116_c0_g1~~TRINITY_DN5116_c0_g1_i10.p1  ORF type:complete len:205 (+),score=24.80 TRINITY_DN5116_c0_g1_i10:63-677(+)
MDLECVKPVLLGTTPLVLEAVVSTQSTGSSTMEGQVSRKKCQIGLGQLTDKNVKQLKILNAVVFPVKYRDPFYDSLLRKPDLSQLAFYNDLFVGAVCCRLEPIESGSNICRLYIMTLGVLPSYRKCGIGSKLLEYVLDYSKKQHGKFTIKDIYLHVQTSNEGAINFYKKFGFEKTDIVKDYYKKLEPPDAFIITRVPDRVPVVC